MDEELDGLVKRVLELYDGLEFDESRKVNRSFYGCPTIYGGRLGNAEAALKDGSAVQNTLDWKYATPTKAETEAARARAKAGNKSMQPDREYSDTVLPKGVKPPNVKALLRAAKRGFRE
jgi:hypothetical protein